jgi:hypothetical protein
MIGWASIFLISLGLVSADSKFNFSGFPEGDGVAPPNKQFIKLYDFSKIPDFKMSNPRHSREAVKCRNDSEEACHWGCESLEGSQNCVNGDILGCVNNNDWALSFDDGIYL